MIKALLPLLLGAALAGAAGACKTPHLAPGLCDANQDLLADPPTDRRQWLDPTPLVMADVPTSDMQARAVRAEPFRRHLETALGRPVQYFVARDYADLLSAFHAGRVHLVNINTGSVEQEVVCAGYVPLVQPVDDKGEAAGLRMEIVVPAHSPIQRPEELKGQTLTFVDAHSMSGFKTPRALLAKDFGLEAGRDYRFDFSGRHDSSLMGVVSGLYAAAAVSSKVRRDLERARLVEPQDLRVIYSSALFLHSPWGVSHRLNPELALRLQQAMQSYVGPADALPSGARFRPADYRKEWAPVRRLNQALGEVPRCD